MLDNNQDISKSSVLLPYTYCEEDKYRVYSAAKGCYLFLKNGKRVLDGLSGSMNANLGHGNLAIANVMNEQAQGLTSLPSIAGDVSQDCVFLAKKLCDFLESPDSVCLFTSSGSEATEAALSIVWKYWSNVGLPQKTKILSLENSYHGCTLGALTITGRKDEHKDISSLTPDFRVSLPAWNPQNDSIVSTALSKLLVSEGAENIAAVFLEPIMGLSGIIPAATNDIRKVVDICHANNILVVLDEALTGLGRTGHVTAADYYGVDYDLLLVSKGLGCGFAPIASTIVSPHIVTVLNESFPALRHGHTSSGNPLMSRVAATVLNEIIAQDVVENANRMGKLFSQNMTKKLSLLCKHYSLRVIGLCIAIQMEDEFLAQEVCKCAFDLGLRVRAIDNNLIACPPLIISQDEMIQLVDMLFEALRLIEQKNIVEEANK